MLIPAVCLAEGLNIIALFCETNNVPKANMVDFLVPVIDGVRAGINGLAELPI
jgi:hypothetical protein